jgi:hypothetical protein
MSQNKGNILKVTLEFENSIITLEGEEAEKWKKMVDSNDVLAHVHGAKHPPLEWTETEK